MMDIFEVGGIYHLYNKAIGNEKLFPREENYAYFLEKYHHYLNDKLETLAFCLIPNHFHFLVKAKENTTNGLIVKAFSDFLNSYSKSINKALGRNGALFQRKFKRKQIDSDDYLTGIVIYIHQNPVKHKLTKDPLDWKYSSYKSYLSKSQSKLNRELVLDWFGGLDGFKISHNSNTDFYIAEELTLE
ncbi:transposase [Cyclobacterium plantarum]|uniref:Transposase n=2 Tax=Cyclobacterium plantarum TaxID=2716263 RepID=A0ABX0HAF3_9BACT|nr:transposase [Cyclobacterium plantarum]NHE57172.1 transposase [Cyclobacterium plantarum]